MLPVSETQVEGRWALGSRAGCGLTYEVACHLLVLLEPAGVTELQQGVDMVGAGLEQDLRGRGQLPVTAGRAILANTQGTRPRRVCLSDI